MFPRRIVIDLPFDYCRLQESGDSSETTRLEFAVCSPYNPVTLCLRVLGRDRRKFGYLVLGGTPSAPKGVRRGAPPEGRLDSATPYSSGVGEGHGWR